VVPQEARRCSRRERKKMSKYRNAGRYSCDIHSIQPTLTPQTNPTQKASTASTAVPALTTVYLPSTRTSPALAVEPAVALVVVAVLVVIPKPEELEP
jgi:hypothetical protein